MNHRLSSLIDFSRWLSAFFVVLGHVAHLLVSPPSNTEPARPVARLFYVLTGLGHDAVMVFFVISGYLVGGITLNKWRTREIDLLDYSIKRFSRIYTVLIPALLLGFVFDYCGLRFFNSAGLYTNTAQYNVGSLDNADVRLGLITFIGNVLMLEGNVVTSFGSNGPLWSLACEWWYYCLFGIVAAGLLMNGWQRVLAITLAFALACLLPLKLLVWMLIWLMGTATFFVCASEEKRPPLRWGVVQFLVMVFGLAAYKTTSGNSSSASVSMAFLEDACVGASYCFLLYCASAKQGRARFEHFHHWAAGFSYSMYLFHFPAMLFLVAAANQIFGIPFLAAFSIHTAFLIFCLLLILYVLGYVFSQCTERHTDLIKNSLKKGLTTLPFWSQEQPPKEERGGIGA